MSKLLLYVLCISNVGIILIICRVLWVLSIFSVEHRTLAIEIARARKELSTTMTYFESPFHVENSERSRKMWIDELVNALSRDNCSLHWHQVQEVDGLTEKSGPLSQIFCFCILSGGVVFLFKTAYLEYRAFREMKNEEARDESQGKNVNLISVAEFLQYR
jgi:hypothetical protein